MHHLFKKLLICTGLAASVLLTSCARPKNPDAPLDPYEKVNRRSFALNQALDSLLFRPLATSYATIVPGVMRKGVSNFFDNFEDVTTVANDVLQARFRQAYSDSWRVVFNTTFGIGGLFDFSTHMGLKKHYEDFGLTLAYWGGHQSAYLNLPLLGPSTFRDGFGKIVDLFALSPWPYIRPMSFDYELYGLYLLDVRSQLLQANGLLEQAFDPYVLMRDAYMQTRDKMIAENNTPAGGEQQYAAN